MSEIIFISEKGNLNLSRLHENQKKYIHSRALNSGIVGGYQSGKSLSAVVKCITTMLENPFVPIAYYLPTYSKIVDMLIPKFKDLFETLGINYTVNLKDSKFITDYGEIWMRSMDNPDSIVSYSVGYSVIDEIDVLHNNKRIEAVRRISGRNSYKKNTKNCIDFVSTPEGFGFMYGFFEKNNNENKKLFQLNTLDNAVNLGDGYIDGLKAMYDEHQLKAYIHGEFINLQNKPTYYNFDRKINNSNEELKEHDHLHIGIDFNIGNMSAVIHIIKRQIIAVDEITKAYDTDELCNIIKQRYPKNRIFVYPDASGRQRQTNADRTDIEILAQYGFIIRARMTNPFVSDRVKVVNRMFRDGKGTISYLINVKKCPEYVEALERQNNDKNGVPDKTSGFDHLTEAGGYFVYYNNNNKNLSFNYQ